MGYKYHAEIELKTMGYIPLDQEQEDGPNKWIQENLFELLEVFSNQGHSGSSASYCIDIFSKLACFEPLTPLTGEDDEWMETGQRGLLQNKRCFTVFKDEKMFDGKPYDIYGKVFVEPDGISFTNMNSCVIIEFPYTQTTEYINVAKEIEDEN
jgi:hypothetical protein